MFRYTFILRVATITLLLSFLIILARNLISVKYSLTTESECSKFEDYNNGAPFVEVVVPNIVHYILFGECEVSFVHYLSILSAVKVVIVPVRCDHFVTILLL